MRKRSSVVNIFEGVWREYFDAESGFNYYTNTKTGASQWEKPDHVFSAIQDDTAEDDDQDSCESDAEGNAASSGWEAITSPEGYLLYYYNYTTGGGKTLSLNYACPC